LFEFCNFVAKPVEPVLHRLTGDIINATTGDKIVGLTGAVVTLTRSDGKTFNAQVDLANSNYSASVEAGGYKISATAVDFIPSETNITFSGPANQNVFLAPIVKDTTGRIVLKWNVLTPRPLDLDLYALNTRNKERVYYLSKRSTSGQLVLDVDDLKGEGPETVTVSKEAIDRIQIFVRNYNKVVPLSGSGAEVAVYRGNERLAQIVVPAGNPGEENYNTWDLGIYDSKAGTFQTNNKIMP
jgi:hypothetical protein